MRTISPVHAGVLATMIALTAAACTDPDAAPPDAAPVDAAPVDARNPAPDAAPTAPDASPAAPDASPTTPDAGPGQSTAPQCTWSACPSGTKLCGDVCVNTSAPEYGCGNASCEACTGGTAATCVANACALDCPAGFADCAAGSCEDVLTRERCGTCPTSCGAAEYCSETNGCVSACTPPETLVGTACIRLTSSARYCGGSVCEPARQNEVASCNAGTCTRTCKTGYTDCFGECRPDGACVAELCGESTNIRAVHWPTQACVCATGFEPSGRSCVRSLPRDVFTCLCNDATSPSCRCESSQWCSDGTCAPLPAIVTGLSAARDLVRDGSTLYLTQGADILSVPVTGGVPLVVATSYEPRAVVPHGNMIFFADAQGGGMYSVPKTGGTPTALVSVAFPDNLAVSGDWMFWKKGEEIQRAPVLGGVAETVYTGKIDERLLAPVADPLTGQIFFMAGYNETGGSGPWRVMSVSPSTGVTSPVRNTGVSTFAVANGYGYLVRNYSSAGLPFPIAEFDLVTGDVRTIGRINTDGSQAMIADEQGVAFLNRHDFDPDALAAVARCGGPAEQLAFVDSGFVALDEQYLYVLRQDAIYRVPR